ncbi:MAG: IscS subfamily cysteine desulfurase [Alphaproteobacteria bacterium]|jgi:cysteine desulfurase|nr:IscS subfamily cysteine desulfurase [Alphaproteobacteria bacterium]
MTKLKTPIYLDYQSTTPTDPRVVDEMLPYFADKFGNPHSRSHAYGWVAEEASEIARENIADLINATSKEIIFTSGATESNNLAIKGLARFHKDKKNHIITAVTEHKCVLDSCRNLESEGFKITYLKVGENGLISIEQLQEAITAKTLLVSIMTANNEIGVLQPIKQIGEICKANNVYFHTDAAQAFGKIKMDVDELNIDLMSISGHKIYGPKGIGALYVRRKPRVRLQSLISGGGQERGFRSGTLATPLVVGLGKAAALAKLEMEENEAHIRRLTKKLQDGLNKNIPDLYLNGDVNERIYGNLNLSFAYIEGESMIMAIKDLAVSSGSACTSASLEPSYVLKAIGVSEELAHTSIRFGIGKFTTDEEIDYAIEVISNSVAKLRELSPLWEMAQEGVDINSIEWSTH